MVPSRPRAALSAVAFFALSGVLELGLTFLDERTPTIETVWDALGRALLHWLLALGLWRGLALCRRLALAAAPVRFPPSVVVQSLLQVPSRALLLPGCAPRLRSRRSSIPMPTAV